MWVAPRLNEKSSPVTYTGMSVAARSCKARYVAVNPTEPSAGIGGGSKPFVCKSFKKFVSEKSDAK